MCTKYIVTIIVIGDVLIEIHLCYDTYCGNYFLLLINDDSWFDKHLDLALVSLAQIETQFYKLRSILPNYVS